MEPEYEKGQAILDHFDAICELCGTPGFRKVLEPLNSLPESMRDEINKMVVTGLGNAVQESFKFLKMQMLSPEVQAKMAQMIEKE